MRIPLEMPDARLMLAQVLAPKTTVNYEGFAQTRIFHSKQ
jgi:hypothetical protein